MPIAALAVTPAFLLLPLLALAGFAGGATNPSRDMIVRNATPPGASGKVPGFVYSGLDVGCSSVRRCSALPMDLHRLRRSSDRGSYGHAPGFGPDHPPAIMPRAIA